MTTMRIPTLALALSATLAVPLAAQCNPCQVDFDGPQFQDNVSMGNVFLGIKTQARTDLVVLRIEIFSGEKTGNSAVMIWSHDANGNKPGAQQARGSFVLSRNNGWQGANLDKPVVLTKGTTFWVVWDTVGGEQGSIQARGPGAQQYRGSFNQGASWNGPFQSWQWKFRLYCCPKNPGTYTTYGRNCPGSNRTRPTIGNTGVPAVGKSFQVNLTQAVANASAFFTLGGSDKTYLGLTLPFDLTAVGAPGCTVLCSYDVILGQTVGAGGGAAQTLAIPNNPSLVGQSFFDQWIVRDPANALGLVFSDAGKGTIGT